VNLPDVTRDPRFDGSVDRSSGFHTRNMLVVPIKDRRGKVLGVLQALNKRSGSFGSEDERYLLILAAQAAVALQNARSFDRLARERNELSEENALLRRRGATRRSEPVGSDPAFLEALRTVRQVANSTANVLIRGESGTGKGIFARYLHEQSPRARRPFTQINCSAIPHDLVEAELFGIERGVATGVEARKGRLEMAHTGSCFLDEIGDMSAEAQAKILKAIEEGELERVGGRRPLPLDIRVIAATHRDLESLMQSGAFRTDLYYRLNVVSVWIPPLRQRGHDLELLAEHFAQDYARRNSRGKPEFGEEFLELLRAYSWPGNVRELENAIERAVILSSGRELDPGALPPEIRGDRPGMSPPADPGSSSPEPAGVGLREALDRYEQALLRRALEQAGGIQTSAAETLGISESNLRYKLKKHELER
jgi:Nif-specific regulatory protein